MDTFSFLIAITGFYCVLLFFDMFFKSCAHYPYLKLLEGLGLKIGYFSIKWNTKAFNRLIIKWGNVRPQLMKLWFQLGVFTSLAFLPISVCLLFYSIFEAFFRKASDSAPLVTPIIPGLNLPLSEIGYYSITLLICSVIHELGHALAAVLYDLGVMDIGFSIYFMLPLAYVSISTEKILSSSLKTRLNVYCAGVWHNILLSFIAYLLYCSLPHIFSPFFVSGKGVTVSYITKNSPIASSSKGLFLNDVITEINDCKIYDEESWYKCLSSRQLLRPAVCIESELVHTLDESVPLKHLGNGYVECCDPNNNKNVCFEYIDIENDELELPGHVCLPGRTVMEKSSEFCTLRPHTCPSNFYCFKPILPNNTFLFKIVCKEKYVIYLGHPNDIYQSIEVSSYVKKNNVISVIFPSIATKLVKYIVVTSLGLAYVNILPFMYMDGEYIIQVLGLILLKNNLGTKRTVFAVSVTTWVFTFLLAFYLVFSIFYML